VKQLPETKIESKKEELNMPETSAPLPIPNAEKVPEKECKTEKKIEDIKKADKEFEELAKKKGYMKKKKDEPQYVIQFKIAWLTFLSLAIGDVIYFLSNAIIDDTWHFTATLWQMLLISIIKDASAILIGKILKYYNAKTEHKEEIPL